MPVVTAPFLKGQPWDHTSIKTSLGLFGSQAAIMLGYLILGAVMLWGNQVVRVIINLIIYLLVLMCYFQAGTTRGASAVNQGEMLFNRQKRDGKIEKKELDMAYHPAKGFLMGIAGCIPFFICAVILAATASEVTSTIGGLPSWVSGIHTDEFKDGIAFYSMQDPINVTDVMRVVIRLLIMPLVNIFDSSNAGSMLLMERLSPLFVMIPGVMYGAGYIRGKAVRTAVHSAVAAGKKKRAKKERRERKQRQLQNHETEKLN